MSKEEKDNSEKTVDAKVIREEHTHKPEKTSDTQIVRKSNIPLMTVLLVVAGLLFIAAVASVTSNIFIRNHSGFMFERNDSSNSLFSGRDSGYRDMHNRGRMMGLYGYDNDSTTNRDAVSGVVTSVNGSNFIIAGGGNQYTVSTTGSTTYNTTDKKVTVNDSVIIIGTIADNTIAALGVRIINY